MQKMPMGTAAAGAAAGRCNPGPESWRDTPERKGMWRLGILQRETAPTCSTCVNKKGAMGEMCSEKGVAGCLELLFCTRRWGGIRAWGSLQARKRIWV